MPVIDVENVSKRFYLRYTREMVATGLFRSLLNRRRSEAFWALRNVSFSVERGESVAIIGPNGSGKTTLLSIISGVTRPTEGRTATQGRVSALLQLGAGFHPDLTGRENVYINAGVLGFRKREIHAIYPSIAEFSELGSFLDVPVRRYSSGMLGRLGFSIAIHVQPEIIIVDEVLSVGDQQFQEKCRDKILAFLETGVTVLFVSHSAAAVRELCQKAVYLEHGEVQAFGEASEVLAAYAARAKRGPPGGAAVRAEGTAGARPTAPPMAPPAASPAAAPTPPSKAPAAPAATTAPADSPAPSAAPPQPDGKAPSSGVPPNRRVPSGPPDARSTGLPSLTCFYRNGPQVAALFDHVLPLIRSGPVLRIRCWGSATGSDAYTLAMEYDRRHITEYRLAIEAFDCNPERVQAAIGGKYNATEVCGKGSSAMPREFLCACFQEDADGGYILRDRIRSRVLFGVGDYLHAACVDLPAADVVMAQDQLVDPEPAAARQAVACLVAQTRPGGVLCLGGTPPDLLVEAAGAHGLEPLTCQIEAIHAGWISGRNPPETAWGRGPVDRSLPDWQIRHCSFFRKPGGGERGASPGDA